MPRLTQYFFLAFLAVASGQTARAQSGALAELYGQGVHSYFCHDYANAQQLLSQVVQSGSVDPRAHYFLGLTQEMMGGDGQADFETGARYEAEGRRVVQVGHALSRIQGRVRSKIEKARRAARIAVLQEKMAAQAERAKMVPKPDPAAMKTTPEIAESPIDAGMTSPDKVPAAEATPEVAAPAAGDTSNPFGDDPEPAAGDPFGGDAPAADPFAEPATPDASTPAADDPFGGSGDDPFGGAGDDPFGGSGDDPFGGSDGGSSNPFE
ncbi:MAG: hypothetical protein Aurels2KO_02330 [Aureliella sp.]